MDHLHIGYTPGLVAPSSGLHHEMASVGAVRAATVPLIAESESPSVTSTGRVEERGNQNDANFLTAEANRKAIFTLVARCALRGVSLSQIQDDAGRPLFIASQGAWTRDLHSLEEVDVFLRRLGGPKA